MEVNMNHELNDELIDLGAVTEETHGGNIFSNDLVGGQLPDLGLYDD